MATENTLIAALKTQIDHVITSTGYLPVRIDVDEDFDALLDALTTGMRTISIYSVPVFINTGLGTDFYYYLPHAPATPVTHAVI